VAAKETKTAYLPTPPRKELDRILCLRYPRIASQGSTISFQGQRYFLLDAKRKVVALHPGGNVMVLKHMDGAQSALYQKHEYTLKELIQSKPAVQLNKPIPKEKAARPIVKPSGNHPWQPKQTFTAKRRLIAKERKRLASLEIASARETDLSEVERETFESLSQVFGMDVIVRNKEGRLIHLNPEPNS
jgi:hypothetical protein